MNTFSDLSVFELVSVSSIATAIVIAIAKAFWTKLVLPFKWMALNQRIKRAVGGKRFRFVFNPETKRQKTVSFWPNGEIFEGRNNNENRWRVRRGLLEIIAADNRPYSSFRMEETSGRLIHTNDIKSRSIRGQYFEPHWTKLT